MDPGASFTFQQVRDLVAALPERFKEMLLAALLLEQHAPSNDADGYPPAPPAFSAASQQPLLREHRPRQQQEQRRACGELCASCDFGRCTRAKVGHRHHTCRRCHIEFSQR